MATTLDQLGRTQEAISVLVKHRARISSQQSVNNMLIPLYQKMGQHREALTLLQHKLNSATSPTQREPILYQIGMSLMHLEEYAEAERTLKKLEKSQPTNLGVQKNLAICLLKQKRYDESERLLKKVLAVTPDEQVTRLLEAVAEARVTGQSSQIDIIIQSALPSFSSETSGFARFFLDRCDFKGVPAEAVQKRQFKRVDLQATRRHGQ